MQDGICSLYQLFWVRSYKYFDLRMWASVCILALDPTNVRRPAFMRVRFLFSCTSGLQVVVFVLQLLSRVRLFATPWTAACQDSRTITNSQSLLKLTSIELVMPSNHLILCHPLVLLPSIFPSIRVFSNESALCIGWQIKLCFFSDTQYFTK